MDFTYKLHGTLDFERPLILRGHVHLGSSSSPRVFPTIPPQKSRDGLFRDGWMDSLIHSFIENIKVTKVFTLKELTV